jgi:hypothetical protein
MMTLCIRYTLDANKLADFEAYARALPLPIAPKRGLKWLPELDSNQRPADLTVSRSAASPRPSPRRFCVSSS